MSVHDTETLTDPLADFSFKSLLKSSSSSLIMSSMDDLPKPKSLRVVSMNLRWSFHIFPLLLMMPSFPVWEPRNL